MRALAEVLGALRRLEPALRRRYPIKALGVFGSWARGEQRPDSDLDVLVEFDRPIGLFDFVGLRDELSDALGLRVDLVMRDAPKPRIARRIARELISL